jgi:glutathione S-transferase
MSSERSLVAFHISPYSERARWALDHHRLSYRTIEHKPYLGERRLRRLVGKEKKVATVPVLIAGDQVITESWDIARYADREGRGTTLIPAEREADIRNWNMLADEAMGAVRGLVTAAMLASPGALDEGLPPAVPQPLRPLFRPIARYGTNWFAKKYGLRADEVPARRAKLRANLETLRARISKDAPYLLGSFSYADVVMAVVLQGVKPVDDRYLRLGPATRAIWTQQEIAEDYVDLLAWRDRLYEQHRAKDTSKEG